MLAQKQLCGFARLAHMKPGEKRSADIQIPYDRFWYWDPMAEEVQSADGTWNRWQRIGGMRTIMAGPSSQDLPLCADIDIFKY